MQRREKELWRKITCRLHELTTQTRFRVESDHLAIGSWRQGGDPFRPLGVITKRNWCLSINTICRFSFEDLFIFFERISSTSLRSFIVPEDDLNWFVNCGRFQNKYLLGIARATGMWHSTKKNTLSHNQGTFLFVRWFSSASELWEWFLGLAQSVSNYSVYRVGWSIVNKNVFFFVETLISYWSFKILKSPVGVCWLLAKYLFNFNLIFLWDGFKAAAIWAAAGLPDVFCF
jgi:hypothetical protein